MGKIVMRRRDDWIVRLAAAVHEREDAPFEWGKFDCCTGAAGLVLAMTGIDVMAPLRGYRTERGALLKLSRFTGLRNLDMDALLAATAERIGRNFGDPEIQPRRAGRGDVVLARVGTVDGVGTALAVVDLSGRFALAASRDGGWARPPMAAWIRAWKV
jgi:hypothetical protein